MHNGTKKQFFSNLNTDDIADNKTFWKTVKPFLTEKFKTKSKITLIEEKYKDNSAEYSEEILFQRTLRWQMHLINSL